MGGMTFTASNGMEFWTNGGEVRWQSGHPVNKVSKGLREFFQHERDQELGRWRWPENPDYVLYPIEGSESVRVLDERNARESLIRRGVLQTDFGGKHWGAARAYFDAHPEAKPWHDAKPGEVWVLTTKGVDDRWNPTSFSVREVDNQIRFYANEPDYSVEYLGVSATAITAGRCIWPEVADA